MELNDISELHYIIPIVNVASVLERGLLCHKRAQHLNHTSCANEDVQNRRASVKVPNGLPLHSYVNLYIHARNAMMYVLRNKETLCVLRIDSQVMSLPNVVVADRNAASGMAAFRPTVE